MENTLDRSQGHGNIYIQVDFRNMGVNLPVAVFCYITRRIMVQVPLVPKHCTTLPVCHCDLAMCQ